MMTYRIKRILNLTAVLFLLTGLGISSAQAAPSDHFVTTWKTDNPGSSNDTSITVPMVGGPYDVDWDNDGVLDEFWLTGPVTHDFSAVTTMYRMLASANSANPDTSAWFEWGTSRSYGNTTAPQTNVGSGTSPVAYSFNLAALQCGTTYHFRAVAANAGGTAYGTDRSFTTAACDLGEMIFRAGFELD